MSERDSFCFNFMNMLGPGTGRYLFLYLLDLLTHFISAPILLSYWSNGPSCWSATVSLFLAMFVFTAVFFFPLFTMIFYYCFWPVKNRRLAVTVFAIAAIASAITDCASGCAFAIIITSNSVCYDVRDALIYWTITFFLVAIVLDIGLLLASYHYWPTKKRHSTTECAQYDLDR